MNSITTALQDLLDKVPRRHSLENMSEINTILQEYEDLLIAIEAESKFLEEQVPVFFDDLESVTTIIKNSNSNKHSKKVKDNLFDDGSGKLKDSIEALIKIYQEGKGD